MYFDYFGEYFVKTETCFSVLWSGSIIEIFMKISRFITGDRFNGEDA